MDRNEKRKAMIRLRWIIKGWAFKPVCNLPNVLHEADKEIAKLPKEIRPDAEYVVSTLRNYVKSQGL